MATTTYEDLVEETRSFLPVGTSGSFTDATLRVFINNALREHVMSGHWRWFRQVDRIEVEEGDKYVPYSDLSRDVHTIVRVVLINSRGGGEPLRPYSISDIDYLQSQCGAPSGYAAENDLIRFAPTAGDSYEIDVHYQFAPGVLSDDDDDSFVPVLYQGVVSLRAAANKALSDKNTAVANDLLARYFETYEKIKDSGERTQVQAPLSSAVYTDNPLASTGSPYFYRGSW